LPPFTKRTCYAVENYVCRVKWNFCTDSPYYDSLIQNKLKMLQNICREVISFQDMHHHQMG
jgi:hypothetical protein